MKIGTYKKAAILATILGGFAIGTGTEAATIAAVGATNFSDTQIGTIEGSYVTSKIEAMPNSTILTGLNGDTSIYSVVDNGKSSIYIRQYTYSITNLADSFSMGAQSDWNNEYANGTVSDGPNAHGVARKNDFIYIADYDKGTVGVGKESNGSIVDYTAYTVNIREDLINYAKVNMEELYAHGESILIEGNTLYVLANIDGYDSANFNYSTYFGYAPSYLLKYDINADGSLSYDSCVAMGKNTDRSRLSKYNNHIFATAIGGYQGYGEVNQETSLNVAVVDKVYGTFEGSNPIKIPDNVYNTEFRNTKIMPNGTAYVLCYAIDEGGWQTITNVYKTTVSNLLSDTPQEWERIIEGTEGGWFNDIDAEHYTKRFWFQDGNTIKVFVDGATEPIVFNTGDFATNEYYNQIQSWVAIKPDTLSGNIAKLRDGDVKENNLNAEWKAANNIGALTGGNNNYESYKNEYGIYAFANDTTIEVNGDYIGDLSNNILASIYANADSVHPEIIVNGVLNLQAENGIATPVGVYAGNGNRISITADSINIITKGMKEGNSLNNAIMLDASENDTQAGIEIGGDVNINMTGGYGGNGVAIQKTDRWGEASYSAEKEARITIDGDLAIKGADNQTWGIEANKENVFSRFNNAGILTAVEKGKVIVKGNVDMDVYGNGVTTNAKDGSVTIVKGGQITVPKGTDYGYYALAAYQGDISMNMGLGGTSVGSNDVKLNGDIFTLSTGNIKLALTTKDSYLNGIVDNGGTVDLYLQNGSVWNNVANNSRYWLDNEDVGNGEKSLVTNFYGGNENNTAGVIVQSKDSKGLTIKNYSGNTKVIYSRDVNEPTKVLGGTVTIESASDNSVITLRTDNSGITMSDDTQVGETLNNLANKLYYTSYVNGQDNLTGYVEVTEGLTASSAELKVENIEFTSNGQGTVSYEGITGDDNTQGGGTTPEDKPAVPETPEQKPVVEEKFEGVVDSSNLDNLKKDKTFGTVVTEEAGKLDFGKLDKDEHDKDKPASEHVDIVKIEGDVKHTGTTPFVWDMDDKGLHIGGKTEVAGGTYEIQNAGDVTFKGNTDVKGDGTNEGVLKIDNKENGGTTKFEGAEGSTAPVLNVGENAKVEVSGKVDITNTNGNVAVEVAKGSTVSFGGGVIGDKDSVAIKVNGGQININANGDEKVVINGKIVLGEAPTTFNLFRMARNIVVPTDSPSITLNGKDSSLNDDVQYLGNGSNDFAITIANGATWTGNSVGGVDLDVILADGGAWTGYHEEGTNNNTLDMQISNGATWTNTATTATTIDTMSGEGGFVKMSEDANAGLDINSYSGDTTFVYAHGYGKDVEDKDLIKGGDVTIKAAADGSVATMRTNNIGTSDKDEVKRVLDALAQKLTYSDVTNKDNLTGKVQIMEGMTTSGATREGLIKFDDTTGKGSLDNSKDVTIDYTGDYIYGDSETAMMKGAKSAMASTVMMWRSESNDILQRMGDLRLATEESGVWAKYYGGKYEMDEQNTNFTTNYKAYQVGYDKAVGNGWNVGVAVSHNEGDSRYDLGGEGEMTVTSLSVYGNKDYGDGRYLGLILKGSQLKNEYEVFNNDHYKLEGDFKTWGTSLSAEYGKRIEKGNGFYFDPSVELTIGHVQGKDYTATSNMLAAYGKTATMQVEQDSFNSIVGRIGFGVGQRTERASYYAKLALAHEFGGDFETSYTAEETKGTSIDFGDTWYEMQLGGTAKLNDNSLLYATYERSFGGDVTEKWRVDAGLRLTF